MTEEGTQIESASPQTLHYTLANQQVQFHRIGEDGQVQVVSVRHFIPQSLSKHFYLQALQTHNKKYSLTVGL